MADDVPVNSSVDAEVEDVVPLAIGDREALTEIVLEGEAIGDRDVDADAVFVLVTAAPVFDTTGDRVVVTVMETDAELDCE